MMKYTSKKQNWGKYYVYLFGSVVIGDIIILNLPYPSWILRFIAVAYTTWLPAIGFLVIGLNPFTDCYFDSKFIHSGNQKKIRIGKIVSRVFVIMFGLMALYIALPIAKDAVLLVKKGVDGFTIIEAAVIEPDTGRYAGYISQYPLLQVVGNLNTTNDYGLYFSRQWLAKGQVYKFLVTPNAKMILALQRIH
jgi:hypothetical protein